MTVLLEFPGGITKCAGLQFEENRSILVKIPPYFYYLVLTTSGIFADIALQRYILSWNFKLNKYLVLLQREWIDLYFSSTSRYLVKKRKNGSGDSIVPWKISSNQEDNYKTNVPINATLIGATVTAVSTAFFILSRIFANDIIAIIIYCIGLIASTIQMPLVLVFTIKHHKNTSKVNPVVPRTLQFHGDEQDCDVDDNNEVDFDMENDETPGNSELFKLVEVQASIENVDETVQLPGQVCHM